MQIRWTEGGGESSILSPLKIPGREGEDSERVTERLQLDVTDLNKQNERPKKTRDPRKEGQKQKVARDDGEGKIERDATNKHPVF